MHSKPFLRIAVMALVAVGSRAEAADPPRVFRAGAATTNISPWLGLSMNGGMRDNRVVQVHDELHARAIVLDDGSTRLALVVCDSCMIPREVVAEAKRRIRERSQLEPDHVLISATHARRARPRARHFRAIRMPIIPNFSRCGLPMPFSRGSTTWPRRGSAGARAGIRIRSSIAAGR